MSTQSMLNQINRYTIALVSSSIDEYVPEGHEARYVVDIAEDMDL